jgi:hypothetical protein
MKNIILILLMVSSASYASKYDGIPEEKMKKICMSMEKVGKDLPVRCYTLDYEMSIEPSAGGKIQSKQVVTESVETNANVQTSSEVNAVENTVYKPMKKTSFFIGGSLNIGSGVVTYAVDDNAYTFTDGDGLTTIDTKFYVGLTEYYFFKQIGSISFETSQLKDMTYSAYGIGRLHQFRNNALKIAGLMFTPEFSYAIGLDSVTDGTEELFGFLLSANLGLSFAIEKIDNLSVNAGLGYDLHAVNDDDPTSTGTWNFTSLNVTAGARFQF